MTAPTAGQPSAEAVEAAIQAMHEARHERFRGLSSAGLQIEMAGYSDANPESVAAALLAAWPHLRRQVIEECMPYLGHRAYCRYLAPRPENSPGNECDCGLPALLSAPPAGGPPAPETHE